MPVITKAIRSIIATVLENALSSIHVVLSFSATTREKKEQKQLLSKFNLNRKIFNTMYFIYICFRLRLYGA
jgi:hypothetical protein